MWRPGRTPPTRSDAWNSARTARTLEADPNPTWMGYSVGRWDGDVLVVDSNGYTDRSWLDFEGHPHTEDLRIIERYTREHRPHRRAGGDDRPQGLRAAHPLHDADEAPGRHRVARNRLREQ